ncbi:hypothetical protein L3i22_060430 [Actinoplanes sp. L3-i22]|nr:hypothetical protein L3i22_060430 [Actinoplanes sp. L3-i22]
MVARDPIPRTRAAVNLLVADVGGPGLDTLMECMPSTQEGKKQAARTTVHDLLTGPTKQPREPRWPTIAAVVRACESYHRQHSGRAAHREMVTAGRFAVDQAAALRMLFDRETGAGPAAPFVVARDRYMQRLRERYGRVDLEILMSPADPEKHPVILLDRVFVAQQVRADPPPVEVPREVWQRLAAAGQDADAHLPEQIDQHELEAALRAYRERPSRPVLEVIAEPAGRKAVLLGDPGAGKSTLARYLLLMLVAIHTSGQDADAAGEPDVMRGPLPAGLSKCLPMLVELRTYAEPGWRVGRDGSFLDLIDHLHTSQDVGLPRSVLEPYLDSGGAAVVVFDGLDEVFDLRIREQVTAQIEGFAARYPQARVVVTSRVIGYRRQLLDAAGFEHWMLQDLDQGQIQAFVTGWYDQSCPDDQAEAARLQRRLLAAITASPAVGELAGNPMLLTILAIIGRRRELPRDRLGVYEHAVTLLVEQWDVNRYLRDERIPVDLLDVRDKLELLQLVARHMQDAPGGLAGNHVSGPSLIDWFRSYLEERFGMPAERSIPAARAMLAQFRERNFILARFGSEVYGFVHRAFLEYLAAADLNRRLTDYDLTPEQVLAIYDRRWNDPAWAEVLLLLTGMIPDRIATQAIARLLTADPYWRVRDRLPRHLLLALQATTEIRKTAALAAHAPALTRALTSLLEEAAGHEERNDRTLPDAVKRLSPYLTGVFGLTWLATDLYQCWYRRTGYRLAAHEHTVARTAATVDAALNNDNLDALHHNAANGIWASREAAVQAIAAGWSDDPDTLPWLRERATTDDRSEVRRAAVEAIAAGWADDPDTLPWLRERATTDDDDSVRHAAVQAIAAGWADDPDTLPWLRERATTDDRLEVRRAGVQAIAAGWSDDPAALPWLHQFATTDIVRRAGVQAIAAGRPDDPDTLPWLSHFASNGIVRSAAVQAIAAGWADDPDTLPWLRERATTDDRSEVRRAAVQAIAAGWSDDPDTLPWLRERATTDANWYVRRAAVQAIAAGWSDDPDTLPWLRERATTTDDKSEVRRAAVEAIAVGWPNDPDTLPWLRERATTDDDDSVRRAAVQAIAVGWSDDPDTLPWLRKRATTDDDDSVRHAAVQAIAVGWPNDPDTLPWLRKRATTDDDDSVRHAAVQAIAAGWSDDPDTLPWLRERATNGGDWERLCAVQAIAAGWSDDPDTLPLLRERGATDDGFEEVVREVAMKAIAAGWPDDPDTLPWLRERATNGGDWERLCAVQLITAGWPDDPDTLPSLREYATNRCSLEGARAVEAIAAGWPDDPDTLPWLRERATTSDESEVRQMAVQAIVAGWSDDPDTLPWLRERATNNDDDSVRQVAVQAIVAGWSDDPDTLPWLRERATTGDESEVRQLAVQAIAVGWPDDPDTLPWLRERATTDDDDFVRHAAVQAIAVGWPNDPDTLPLLREYAITDSNDRPLGHVAVGMLGAVWADNPGTRPVLREHHRIQYYRYVR